VRDEASGGAVAGVCDTSDYVAVLLLYAHTAARARKSRERASERE
jgi:hypothetical protein